MKVNFNIERLIIEGASHAEAMRLADALRTRLAELPAAGLMARPSSIARLDAGVLPQRSNAEQIGAHIATQIFASLKGPRRA